MDNSSLMNRENKKRQLRRQIVPPRYQTEEESEQAIRNAHKKTVRKRLAVLAVVAVLLGGAAFGIYYYDRYHSFYDYQVVWEKSLAEENQEAAVKGEGSFCEYVDFGDGVIKYTKDGASYIDGRGKTIWIHLCFCQRRICCHWGQTGKFHLYLRQKRLPGSGNHGAAYFVLICICKRSGSLCTGRLQSKLYLSL